MGQYFLDTQANCDPGIVLRIFANIYLLLQYLLFLLGSTSELSKSWWYRDEVIPSNQTNDTKFALFQLFNTFVVQTPPHVAAE